MISIESTDYDHPLPLMVGDQEVRRSHDYTPRQNPYDIRFTPYAQGDTEKLPDFPLYNFTEIMEDFIHGNNLDIYIVTCERKPYLHFHIYIETDQKLDKVKKMVQAFIYPYYPNRVRGFGTAQLYCQIAENPLQCITYSLKQKGRLEWSGFTQEFIDECLKHTFEKKDTDFEKELRDLTELFLSDDLISPTTFGSQVALLYSKFDKRVHWKDIQGYVNSKLIKRDPDQAFLMASKFLSF